MIHAEVPFFRLLRDLQRTVNVRLFEDSELMEWGMCDLAIFGSLWSIWSGQFLVLPNNRHWLSLWMKDSTAELLQVAKLSKTFAFIQYQIWIVHLFSNQLVLSELFIMLNFDNLSSCLQPLSQYIILQGSCEIQQPYYCWWCFCEKEKLLPLHQNFLPDIYLFSPLYLIQLC